MTINRRAVLMSGLVAGLGGGAHSLRAETGRDGALEASAHGLVGDGVRDNTEALSRLLDLAMASGRNIVFSGPGDYRIDGRIQKALTGPLRIKATAGARLLVGPAVPNSFELSADTRFSGVRLVAPAAYGAMSVRLAVADGVAPGDVITLATSTSVCRTYLNYHKIVTGVVAAVDGDTVHLREPLNFPFAVEETKVTVYKPAVLEIEGLTLKAVDARARCDIWGVAGARIENCVLEGVGRDPISAVLFVARCADFQARRLTIRNVTYGLSIGQGSRNVRIESVHGSNCIHPVDLHTWAYGVHIRDLIGIGNGATVNSHPAFEVWYDGVIEQSLDGIGMSLRSIGGGLRNARLEAPAGVLRGSVATVSLLPEYEFLMADAERRFENVYAPTATFVASECARAIVRNCTFAAVAVDGASNKVGSIEIVNTRAADRMRRIKRIATGAAVVLPLREKEDGGRLWRAADVKDDVNLGFHPKLSYSVEMQPVQASEPAALFRIPFRLYHHHGIHEANRRTGSLSILVVGESRGSAFARFRYDSAARRFFDVEASTPQGTKLPAISIAGATAGADREGEDRFYLQFELVIQFERSQKTQPRIKIDVEEERL